MTQLFLGTMVNDSQGKPIDTGSRLSAAEIGRMLLKVSQVTPKGVVTFFKDFTSMNMFIEEWKKIGLLKSLEEVKPYVVESQDPSELKKALKKFNDNVEISGANFFLTMRGKCAENISFRDNMARTIILIGVPSLNHADQATKLRLRSHMSLMQKTHQKPEEVAKRTALLEPMANLVTRLSSLVIKHANDYGAVILVGQDYGTGELLRELPLWMTANLRTTEEQTMNLITDLHEFMKQASRSRIKNLHLINKNASFKVDNQSLAERNQLFRNLGVGQERKFVALNPERRTQIWEHKQKLEQERKLALQPPAPVDPVQHQPTKAPDLITGTQEQPEEELSKSLTKIKLNTAESLAQDPSKPRQSDDSDLAITYIANSEALRTTDNCIPLAAVMRGRDERAKVMCNICYESDNHRFFVSKCGHISCEICWEIRLRDMMECPICKQKVRRKTLIEIVG